MFKKIFTRKHIFAKFCFLKLVSNKKVLLRECKRHTACHVVSTHSVVLSWLTPPQLIPPWLTPWLTLPLAD